jgi:hypothetical protein
MIGCPPIQFGIVAHLRPSALMSQRRRAVEAESVPLYAPGKGYYGTIGPVNRVALTARWDIYLRHCMRASKRSAKGQ